MNATYFGLNWEAAKSLIAKALAVIGVIIIERYGISSGTWESIAGIVIAVAAFLWSLKANTPAALSKAAASQTGVTVVAPPTVAKAANSIDVLASSEVKIVEKK